MKMAHILHRTLYWEKEEANPTDHIRIIFTRNNSITERNTVIFSKYLYMFLFISEGGKGRREIEIEIEN